MMMELISYMQKNHHDMVDSTIEQCEADTNRIELELGLKLPQSYKDVVNKFGTLELWEVIF